MRPESKHRHLKLIASSQNSKRDLLITISKRLLLHMISYKYKAFNQEEISIGQVDTKDFTAFEEFPSAIEASTLKSVTINGIRYTPQIK